MRDIINYAEFIAICCLYLATVQITASLHYVGCYQGSTAHYVAPELPTTEALTIEICIQRCRQLNKTYAIIQGGVTCLCGDGYGDVLPDSDCQVPCAGNKQQYCGGRITADRTPIYVVYTAKSFLRQYIGCYKDAQQAAMEQKFHWWNGNNNTIESCIRHCAYHNYTYAGLQYGFDCFCGNSYNKYGPLPESSCNMTCSGNFKQTCGGNYANTVYAVNDIFWCSNDSDCKSKETCTVIDLKYMNISRCRCKQGFHRNSQWEYCTDIDECQSGTSACNSESTNCINSIGSYRCECKNGFQMVSDKCIDIDECRNESLVCNAATEQCKNTFGSYVCQCKNGYASSTNGQCTDIDECKSGTSFCDPKSAYCFNSLGSYICVCKDGFTLKLGECVVTECNSTPTTGIILGAVLAISLIVIAFLVFSRINSARSEKPEVGKSVSQPEFKPSSTKTSDQREITYDEIPAVAGQTSVYEQINMNQRQTGINSTSTYAALIKKKESKERIYMNVESPI